MYDATQPDKSLLYGNTYMVNIPNHKIKQHIWCINKIDLMTEKNNDFKSPTNSCYISAATKQGIIKPFLMLARILLNDDNLTFIAHLNTIDGTQNPITDVERDLKPAGITWTEIYESRNVGNKTHLNLIRKMVIKEVNNLFDKLIAQEDS